MVEKNAALTFNFYLTFNISMQILHTVLYTNPKMLTICLKFENLFKKQQLLQAVIISFTPVTEPQVVIQGWYCRSLLGIEGFNMDKQSCSTTILFLRAT